ncbi:class I SAM-dependent methyltransferase [Streptomyces clavuligerus]|uniref:Methyltransferase type 11 n=1 Tax=Streptomyces clavuligerus TaxID=1901 RepID=B5GVU2_STRCL|nr:class I SAM-dependent methyltransferase [Streptomyces clavuligerus]EDY50438.1 methyltransferase type 11 [Streptomyces clavuligerus]EFG03519.1 Methyltransferase type 11 [Streptomyces clavuligerus]QCS09557.1 methyltransferase domain-containing protein [Streptomyces clavuligerus]QPJ98390.1 methyltransferase domain-containing protein [Streptomyces clavuligerus]WDN56281.1 class I SAM-dependent methyltransferase [Streptomyces clavuligerus]
MTITTTWYERSTAAHPDPGAAYDRLAVPAIFHPWAAFLVGAIGPRPGGRALDVACGPGTLVRVLAGQLGESGAVTGTDINPSMLDAANARAAVAGAPQDYHLSGAAPLEGIDDGAFDLITCQQGFQFFPDRPAAAAEWYRVGRPGATLAVAFWSAIDHNPLFDALHHAVATVLGPDRTGCFTEPCSLSPEEAVRAVEDAGFTGVRQYRATLSVTFPGGTDDLMCLYRISSLAETVAALDPDEHLALEATIHERLAPYQEGTAVTLPTSTEILLATR